MSKALNSLTFIAPEGELSAKYLFVGEAPGREELEKIRPFVGRAGLYLRMVLAELCVHEDDCFFTNVCKVRPEGNRRLFPQEIASWSGLLHTEIRTVQPELVILMGDAAMKAGLKTLELKLSNELGGIYERDGLKFLVTHHPSSASRFPEKGDEFKEHLKGALT